MTALETVEHEYRVPIGISRVFELLSDPTSLDRLTPAWFRLAPRAPLPAKLGAGAEISYDFRWRGLALPWTSRITSWAPPLELTYEQKRGPYQYFRHEHYFREIEGGTEIRDRILFRSHAGRWIDRWVTRADLERILLHRERRVSEEAARAQEPTAVVGRASLMP